MKTEFTSLPFLWKVKYKCNYLATSQTTKEFPPDYFCTALGHVEDLLPEIEAKHGKLADGWAWEVETAEIIGNLHSTLIHEN